MARRFVSVCSACRKYGTRTTTSLNNGPTTTPSVPGKCPSSSDGKHKPRWEEE